MTAEEISEIRAELGIGVHRMGRALGVGARSVYYYETGGRPIPEPVAILARLIRHDTRIQKRVFDMILTRQRSEYNYQRVARGCTHAWVQMNNRKWQCDRCGGIRVLSKSKSEYRYGKR